MIREVCLLTTYSFNIGVTNIIVMWKTVSMCFVIIVIHVDAIILITSNMVVIFGTKAYLHKYFVK